MSEEPVTLASKLGTSAHISGLRMKARRLGLLNSDYLINEAVARGCFHYMRAQEPPVQKVEIEALGNEELALALLTIANPYDSWMIRVGAMMLGAEGNDPKKIARLAEHERSESVVRAIVEAALRYEPENGFWHELLDSLPDTPVASLDVMPHHTRFVSMPGLIGPRVWGKTIWLRPRKIKSLGYAI